MNEWVGKWNMEGKCDDLCSHGVDDELVKTLVRYPDETAIQIQMSESNSDEKLLPRRISVAKSRGNKVFLQQVWREY